MPKNCISIYNEFSNIGPTRRTWTWRIKVDEELQIGRVEPRINDPVMAPCFYATYAFYILLFTCIAL